MIKHLLNQTITIYRLTGHNGEGIETWGSGTAARARVEVGYKQRLMPNKSTQRIDAVVFVARDEGVDSGDRITYGDKDYKVVFKHEAVDDLGRISHLELEVVRWLA